MRVSNHAKQRFRLWLLIDNPVSVENFVPTVLRIGLCEHHQLDVGRVALQGLIGVLKVLKLIF